MATKSAALFIVISLIAASFVLLIHVNIVRAELKTGRFLNYQNTWGIQWEIDTDAEEFTATIEAKTTGWVGFGFSPKGLMANSDIIHGWVRDNDSTVFIWDRYARTGHVIPILDTILKGYNDVEILGGKQNDTWTSLTFRRALVTNDTANDIAITEDVSWFIWSYGAEDGRENGFAEKHVDKGAVKVNFFTGFTHQTRSSLKKLAHGCMMMLAWGCCVLWGNVTARFLRPYFYPAWYINHLWMEGLAMALTFSAFVVVIFGIQEAKTLHFHGGHQIFGLIIVILGAVITPAVGIIGSVVFGIQKGEREKVPVFPDRVHGLLGKIMVFLSIANCFYGMFMIEAVPAVYVLFAIAWLCSVVCFLAMHAAFWDNIDYNHILVMKKKAQEEEEAAKKAAGSEMKTISSVESPAPTSPGTPSTSGTAPATPVTPATPASATTTTEAEVKELKQPEAAAAAPPKNKKKKKFQMPALNRFLDSHFSLRHGKPYTPLLRKVSIGLLLVFCPLSICFCIASVIVLIVTSV